MRKTAIKLLHQQERFDAFIEVYHHRRPHQVLGDTNPKQLHTPSPRLYQPPEEPAHPCHDGTVPVTHCERICIGKQKISLSHNFANQVVGIREVTDRI